jgi:hypothetical protein
VNSCAPEAARDGRAPEGGAMKSEYITLILVAEIAMFIGAVLVAAIG